jgi:hypothetical protein
MCTTAFFAVNRNQDPEVIMPFRLNHLGDDEANDIPHFEEDDELGSVRDETLEEEADEELMVPAERDSMNIPPPPSAPPKKKSTKKKVRRGRKARRRSAAGGKARRSSRSRRGGTRGARLRKKARKAKSRPKKKSKARRRGKGRKRR